MDDSLNAECLVLDHDEVRKRVVAVSRRLLEFAAGSFGPRGRSHLIQANRQCPDALTLTSTSATYLEHIRY